jgi:hypothetical protein
MARCNSLMTVLTDVWKKTKRRRESAEEEKRHMRKARRASIRTEMARRGLVIVDYSDDSYLSDDSDDCYPVKLVSTRASLI